MTVTCTIIKAGRCDSYGIPLAVGQTYTGREDEVRSLWQAGYCTVSGAPKPFEPATYPPVIQVASSSVPFVIPPGDGASNGLQFSGASGAFTLSAAILTNIWAILKGCWMYLPANFGGTSYPAGWYWAVFSSDTAGVVYPNTYLAGPVERVNSPSSFVENLGGWLTSPTAEITGPTGFVVPAGFMGRNGVIKSHLRTLGNATGNKIFRMYAGSTVIGHNGSVTTSPDSEMLMSTRNQGVENLQANSRQSSTTGTGVQGATFTLNTENSVADFSTEKVISVSLQMSTSASCAVLTHFDMTCVQGV